MNFFYYGKTQEDLLKLQGACNNHCRRGRQWALTLLNTWADEAGALNKLRENLLSLYTFNNNEIFPRIFFRTDVNSGFTDSEQVKFLNFKCRPTVILDF